MGGDADGDRYFNIEDIRDSRYGDILIGDDGNNAFFQTGAGDGDVMNGGGGDDTFYAAYGSAFLRNRQAFSSAAKGLTPSAISPVGAMMRPMVNMVRNR